MLTGIYLISLSNIVSWKRRPKNEYKNSTKQKSKPIKLSSTKIEKNEAFERLYEKYKVTKALKENKEVSKIESKPIQIIKTKTTELLPKAIAESNEIESKNKVEEQFVQSLTFNRYIEEKEFDSIEKARISFIREFGINYVLMSNERELPAYLKNMFEEGKIGIIDNYSIYQRAEGSL